MDMTPFLGVAITLLLNLGTIVYLFGTLTTRLNIAERTLEELRSDFKQFGDLKAHIAEIRLQQVHNLETLGRLERLFEKWTSKENAQ